MLTACTGVAPRSAGRERSSPWIACAACGVTRWPRCRSTCRPPASDSARSGRSHGGQIGPSSDLDLVIIYEPHTINDQQLNELTNKLWYPLWDSGLDLDQSVRTRQQCEAVTDSDLPAAMGLAGCQADRRRYGADFGDGHVDSGTLASSGPQAAAGTAEFGAQATGRVRTTRLPEPARHQGGARRSARFGAGLRVDCVMACRPTARPV